MKHLIIAFALLFATPVAAQQTPPGAVRIYVYEDGDQLPDALGSGALISPTQILTNWHVVESRRGDPKSKNMSVEVRFPDGSRRYAVVLQQDRAWDLALLQIHPTELKPFTIGGVPEVGDLITVQGFGFDYEYEAGVGVLDKGQYYIKQYGPGEKGVIQVNAYAVRQGDSGGPMTDSNGHLVGILNAADQGEKITVGVTLERAAKVFGDKFKPSDVYTGDNDGSIYLFESTK